MFTKKHQLNAVVKLIVLVIAFACVCADVNCGLVDGQSNKNCMILLFLRVSPLQQNAQNDKSNANTKYCLIEDYFHMRCLQSATFSESLNCFANDFLHGEQVFKHMPSCSDIVGQIRYCTMHAHMCIPFHQIIASVIVS